jgi:hypothetical protein
VEHLSLFGKHDNTKWIELLRPGDLDRAFRQFASDAFVMPLIGHNDRKLCSFAPNTFEKRATPWISCSLEPATVVRVTVGPRWRGSYPCGYELKFDIW